MDFENEIELNENIFENIKHIDENGAEFWYARELQEALEYKKWVNFSKVIEKAKEACENSNNEVSRNFADVGKIVKTGVSEKTVDDIKLTRYACYIIVMNGDPRKEVIALGQTYFAIKTRQQELIENYDKLSENQKRLAIRHEVTEHNKSLAEAAKNAGIGDSKEYALFQNYGYKGLYGGMTAQDIHKKKGLKKSQKILDHKGERALRG